MCWESGVSMVGGGEEDRVEAEGGSVCVVRPGALVRRGVVAAFERDSRRCRGEQSQWCGTVSV